jgi:hypothetical protein
MRVTHSKQSGITDNDNSAQVQPSDWNDDHAVDLDQAIALLATLTPAPDQLPYFVDANTAGMTALTAFVRSLLASASASALLSAIGALPIAGGTMVGELTLAADPTQALDAATKQYVDNIISGWKPKQSVRAASTTNISIASPGTTIDGVALNNGDRVALMGETDATTNGIYIFNGAASAMTRASDFNLWSEIPGSQFIVEEGTANADSGWVCSANEGGTLGSTAINFSQFFGTGLFQAASAKLSTLAALASVANLSTLANLSSISNLSALAGLVGAANKVPSFTGAGAMALLAIGTAANNLVQLDGSGRLPAVDGSQLTGIIPSVLNGYLYGLALSTAGSSATFAVAAGVATDSTNSASMAFAGTNKTTAAWAVGAGNGALDTGTIAASTWYHVFLIKRTDSGGVDVLISLSATTPTMPTNYTLKRRIGSLLTNASSQWTLFHQNGDEILWDARTNNVSGGAAPSAASLVGVTVPTGVQVNALLYARADYATAATSILITSPDESDQAPGSANASLFVNSTNTPVIGMLNVRTDTSGRVRVRAGAAGPTYTLTTVGYIDRRGRDG